MKLYSTITSERASKGQGGNEYLYIEILNDKKEIIAQIEVLPDSKDIVVNYNADNINTIKRIPWRGHYKIKGKKLKTAKGCDQGCRHGQCAYNQTF